MKDESILLKELTGRDETKAQKAADYLVNSADLELYKSLAAKSDFLFPFVIDNVSSEIEKAVTKSNFKNIIKFFDCYCAYYDDLFASILAKHADENLTDEILEMLENGSDAQKTYCAKYFSYIPDTAALEILSRYAFSDDENLCSNAAEALGVMEDDVSYDIALNSLEHGGDFDKLKAVKFFSSYNRNFPFKQVFNALKNTGMPENIAGLIPYAESPVKLLESGYKQDMTEAVYYIISGLGEILPISDIFRFELYKVLSCLINLSRQNTSNPGWIAADLLSAYAKFKMFLENDEYLYDEDKNTKQETASVYKLLDKQGKAFWDKEKKELLNLLNGSEREITSALNVISEFNIIEAAPAVKKISLSANETTACEALNTLKNLNRLDNSDIDAVLPKIKNENIRALIESMRIV